LEHWKAMELASSRKGYWRMAKVLNQIFSNKIIVCENSIILIFYIVQSSMQNRFWCFRI
jgi:hypothetical protein